MSHFLLHEQLEKDTSDAGNLSLCSMRIMNDRRFPWVILVPRRADMRELIDLLSGDQRVLLGEINHVSRVLQRAYKPDKINIAALGNMVPQLHIHIIARFQNDAAWPKPVWGVGEAERYDESGKAKITEALAGR